MVHVFFQMRKKISMPSQAITVISELVQRRIPLKIIVGEISKQFGITLSERTMQRRMKDLGWIRLIRHCVYQGVYKRGACCSCSTNQGLQYGI